MDLSTSLGALGVLLAQEMLMRIGIVTSSYAISPTDTVTAGVFVRDLAHELASLGHQVHVLTPRKYGERVSSPLVIEYYFPWLGSEKDLASASPRDLLTLLRYGTLVASGLLLVGQYAQAHALEALLAMWAIPSGIFSWATWKWHGIPYGVWALGSDIWARHKYPWGDRIVRTVLRDARFRFADGTRLADEVAQLAGAPCEFVPSVRRLQSVGNSESITFPPASRHFLFIGRYEHNKGPDILIETMRQLLDRGNKAHLHMFGVGSLETHLRQKARGYEQYIHIGGYAEPRTVVAYMRACDWLVIPSRLESIPLIFVDALQMCLPVIVTDVGDLGDLVRRFGVGKVVSAAEPRVLAITLQEALPCARVEFAGAWQEAQEAFRLSRSAKRCITALTSAQKVDA
jgi:glycosyltransferase involved in cell wall biosynthesis